MARLRRGLMLRAHGGSVDTGNVLGGPADNTGAGGEVADCGAVDARCMHGRRREAKGAPSLRAAAHIAAGGNE